jgi:hypothetical protein
MDNEAIATASQVDPDVRVDPYDPVTVWFDDGNLIVHTGEKTFRVYRGILTRASPVFRDMVSLAKEESSDGCPSVSVFDAAADVSFFLMSLHDPE